MSAQAVSRCRFGWAVVIVAACGCNKAPVAEGPTAPGTGPTATANSTVRAPSVVRGAGAAPAAVPDDKLHQSFEQACTIEFSADSGQQLPPDRTIAGKPTAQLNDAVYRAWSEIRFVSPAGKPLTYVATLNTELGPIEMALLPEIAPNHARNFIALARSGYYDGLVFERIIRQTTEDGTGNLELVEAGCPLGTGEAGLGHIGYWVKPEFSETLKHEPGLVGALHDADPNTDGCRFYVALSPAPVLDGHFTIFAKVTKGLDVVRQIAGQPTRTAPGEEGRPERPVVIRSVTIAAHEAEN